MCPMQQICSPKKIQKSPETISQDSSPKRFLIKLCFQRERVHTVAHKIKGCHLYTTWVCTCPVQESLLFFSFSYFSRFFSTFTNKTYKMWSHLKFHRNSFLYIENHHHDKLLKHEMSGVWDGITCPGNLKYWWPGSDKKENTYEQARQTLRRGHGRRQCNPKRQEGKCMSSKALFTRILHPHIYNASSPPQTPFSEKKVNNQY